MEIILGLMAIVFMLVWMMVGITIIATSLYYLAVSRPMIKQYKQMLKELSEEIWGGLISPYFFFRKIYIPYNEGIINLN